MQANGRVARGAYFLTKSREAWSTSIQTIAIGVRYRPPSTLWIPFPDPAFGDGFLITEHQKVPQLPDLSSGRCGGSEPL